MCDDLKMSQDAALQLDQTCLRLFLRRLCRNKNIRCDAYLTSALHVDTMSEQLTCDLLRMVIGPQTSLLDVV